MCKNHSLGWFFVVPFSMKGGIDVHVVVSTRPDGGAAMGGSLRSSLAGCAHLPIHIAMGGYASHGRTSVPGFEVTGCW